MPEGRFGEEVIVAKGVVKTYDTGKVKVHALRGVDLRVRQGEMVSIMGPSGCGKTTLLNCLSGLDDVTEGEVVLEGKNLANLTDNQRTDLRAKRLGFIFQFYNLLPVLSAAENVELPLLVSGMSRKDARARAVKALAMVGLSGRETHKPSELSGGERQRVTIARSLVNEPAIIFADEPTGDLDTKTSEEIMKLLVDLNRSKGLTFLIVTHDPKVGELAHRIVRMDSGQVVKEYIPCPSDIPAGV